MPAYGVSVEKELTFRGGPERFHNVYHYRITTPIPSDYDTLADAVVAMDRQAYPSSVTYKTVRVFGPTEGPESANLIRLVKDLSGGGTMTAGGSGAYPELCYTISMPAGRSPTTQRRVYVRKFIRAVTLRNSGDQGGTGLVSATSQTAFKSWMEDLKNIGTAVTYDMVTPRDQLVPADAVAVCLPYLHVRQIKQ